MDAAAPSASRSGLGAGLTVFISITALAAIDPDATDSVVLFVMILAASATIGLHEDRTRALLGGAVALVALLILIRVTNGYLAASDVFVGVIFALGPLGGGMVVRSLTERNTQLEAKTKELERLQAEQAEAAVTEERTRIANELHSVIAQGVSVMTVQASGARLLLQTDPDRAREAILAVEETGREALTETRRLLGILRRDTTEPQLAPQPGVASLQSLIDREVERGMPVTLTVEGEPRPLPSSVAVTAYRVVHDALASIREHVGVTTASVTIRYEPQALEVAVEDDGRARRSPDAAGLLAALSERLRLHGGSIETSPRPNGSCLVNARIPLEARE